MIDIHCHILHGVDDGALDLQESIAMAELAYADGIRHIAATPHFTENYANKRHIVEWKVLDLQKELDTLGIGITLRAANEVRLESVDFVLRHAEEDSFGYLDAGKRFVLLEQRWSDYEPDTLDVIAWFQARGTTPVFAHPERHNFFRQNPMLVTGLVNAGSWTQVSVDSLLGKNGEEAADFAFWLLEQDMIHTLATDAHNTRRKPNLSEGFQLVREKAGAVQADAILARMNIIMENC